MNVFAQTQEEDRLDQERMARVMIERMTRQGHSEREITRELAALLGQRERTARGRGLRLMLDWLRLSSN